MKIGVSRIIKGHLSTLRDADTGKILKSDIVLFYLVPFIFGVFAYFINFCIPRDAYNISITFFGIFIALLLNIQVAIFGIHQKRWEAPSDRVLAELQERTLKNRRELIGQLNSNISYLIVVSSLSLIIFLLFFIGSWADIFASIVSVILYIHFFLTLMMVIKRSHALFEQEYR